MCVIAITMHSACLVTISAMYIRKHCVKCAKYVYDYVRMYQVYDYVRTYVPSVWLGTYVPSV